MNIQPNRLYKILSIAILFIATNFVSTISVLSQSITVIVKDEKSLEINQIDIFVVLTETKYDYIQPEYPELNIPKPISNEEFINELINFNLQANLIDSKTESEKHYVRSTKKEQVKTITMYNYVIEIKKKKELNDFQSIMANWPNIKIKSTNFESKNDDILLKELTSQMLASAKSEANKMAELIEKEVTNMTNIKVINMQTQGHPNQLVMYTLDQKAYLELEVTFETKNLE